MADVVAIGPQGADGGREARHRRVRTRSRMLAGIVTALLVGVLLFNGAILTPGALSHAALSIGPGAVLFVVAQVMEVGREIEQDRDGFV